MNPCRVSPAILLLYHLIESDLNISLSGPQHLLVAILRGSLVHDLSSTDSLAAGQDVRQEGEKVDYNPLDAGVLVEGGKVIGQNSIRVAGRAEQCQH